MAQTIQKQVHLCNLTGLPFEEVEFEDAETWGVKCSECDEVLFQEGKPFR